MIRYDIYINLVCMYIYIHYCIHSAFAFFRLLPALPKIKETRLYRQTVHSPLPLAARPQHLPGVQYYKISHPTLTPSSLPVPQHSATVSQKSGPYKRARASSKRGWGYCVPGTAPFGKRIKCHLNHGSQAIPAKKTEAAWTALRPALLFKAVTLKV